MKHTITAFIMVLLFSDSLRAQETFGRTLNIGLGVGYYGYTGTSTPVFNVNYEFDVAKDFTLAPFVGLYSYTRYRYWGNPQTPYRDYYYRETVAPVGVKGSYYFDDILNAGSRWDFYLAGSLGFNIHKVVWEDGYSGDRAVFREASPLYLDLHIGSEYHINDRLGVFLDLSSGVSTIGLAIH